MRFIALSVLPALLIGCGDNGPTTAKQEPPKPRAFSAADIDETRLWLAEISEPLHAFNSNQIGEKKNQEAFQEAVKPLIGKEVSWEVKLWALNKDGIMLAEKTHTIDGREIQFGFYPTTSNPDKIELNIFPLPKKTDHLASLKRNDPLIIRGTVDRVRFRRGRNDQGGPLSIIYVFFRDGVSFDSR